MLYSNHLVLFTRQYHTPAGQSAATHSEVVLCDAEVLDYSRPSLIWTTLIHTLTAQIQLWTSLHTCESRYIIMNIISLVHYLNHLHAFTSPNKSTNQNISRNSAVQISKGLLYKELTSSFLRLKNSMIQSHCSSDESMWTNSAWGRKGEIKRKGWMERRNSLVASCTVLDQTISSC